MTGTKSILRTVAGGLLLAAVLVLGGCGGGHGRHISHGRDSYPTYSRSGGGHDRDGGYRGGHRSSDRGGHADRSDGWRRR